MPCRHTIDKPPVLHRRLLNGITAQYANGRKLHKHGVLTEYRKRSTEHIVAKLHVPKSTVPTVRTQLCNAG